MKHCEEALRRVRYGYQSRGWPLRFPASVDTLPKGRDVEQARCASKGSAVPKADAQ